METWLLLHMFVAEEFWAKKVPLNSAIAPKVPVSNIQQEIKHI